MGKRFWIGVLLLSFIGAACASGPRAVRRQVESSLLVTGSIDIGADGRVAGYTLYNAETLGDDISGMIARAVPMWRFEPPELEPGAARAHARMNLRLVARKLEDGNLSVRFQGVRFLDVPQPGESVVSNKLQSPVYPQLAARHGVGGTVYTVVKIGRDGRVEDAIAEQVNLRIVTSEKDMKDWRNMLAKAALQAVKHWTFSPPTKGDEVDRSFWIARVPVDFIAPGHPYEPLQWQAYVPGPRQQIPWNSADRAGDGADAFAAGGTYPVGGGPRLLGTVAQP